MAENDQTAIAVPSDGLDLAWLRLELQRTRDSLASGDVEGAFELADRAWQYVARAADQTEHRDQKTGRAAQASPEGVPCGGVSRQDQVPAAYRWRYEDDTEWRAAQLEPPDDEQERRRVGQDSKRVFEPLFAGPPWKPTHQHLKRRSRYRLVGSATLQTSIPLRNMDAMAVYQAEDGSYWVRPDVEFYDGRFLTLVGKAAG